ncbi:MAG: hypothetical protein ACMVO5_11140 [Polymorphobacter sp.]|uniref:hypothetical protein n=1 Tax=Polymorphobacter sp. TaxID=1909290 RepID=UPI003A867B96
MGDGRRQAGDLRGFELHRQRFGAAGDKGVGAQTGLDEGDEQAQDPVIIEADDIGEGGF